MIDSRVLSESGSKIIGIGGRIEETIKSGFSLMIFIDFIAEKLMQNERDDKESFYFQSNVGPLCSKHSFPNPFDGTAESKDFISTQPLILYI